MRISTSNILDDNNTSVVTDGSSVPIDFMINKDFSEIYRSGTTSNFFRILLDVPGIEYIALAGLDVFGVCETIDFEYWNGSDFIVAKSYNVTSNATIMFSNIVNLSAQKWRLTFTKTFSNLQVGIAHIAAGSSWNVVHGGEQSGYARPWSTPQYKQRTQNNLGAPTSEVVESTGVSSTLSINNIPTDVVDNIWAPFQGFSVREGFFISEDVNDIDKSYYCYNCQPSAVKAHSQTRSLQNGSIKFSAWTGRTI